MEINDKVAFITGGSGGLGSVIALRLAASGANIAISYGQNLAAAYPVLGPCGVWGICIFEVSHR